MKNDNKIINQKSEHIFDWLQEIPQGWKTVKLKELFAQRKSYSSSEEELLSVYRDYGVVPKSSRNDNHNKTSDDISKYILIEPDDLVVNKMKAWQGSLAISGLRGIVSPAYFTYRPKPSIKNNFSLRYLHFLLRSKLYIEAYKKISNGIRPQQWDLDPYYFKMLPVLCPPLEEQIRIAHFLDSKIKVVEDLISKKQQIISIINEKRKSIITKIVTSGLNLKVKTKKSNIDWIGDIPNHWNVKRGKFIFRFKKELNNKYQCEKILALTLKGVMNKEDYEEPSLTPTDYGSYQVFYPEDLVFKLIDLENYQTSRVGIVAEKGIMSPAYIRISPLVELDSRYFYWFYYSLYLQGIYNFLGMGVRSTLNQEDLLNLPAIIPPLDEQKSISKYLDSEVRKMEQAISLTETQIFKLREYRTSLIYASVTGKIKM